MWEYIIRKYKGVILFTIGSLLIVFALYLALYSRVQLIKEQVFSEVEFFIENEKNDNEGENNNQENDENPNNNNNEGEIDNIIGILHMKDLFANIVELKSSL